MRICEYSQGAAHTMSPPPEQNPISPLITAPQFVVGYHGCSRAAAETILSQQQFVPSTKEFDWLGKGIYFWEYAPYRALDWAIQRCSASGEEPAVVCATIQLGRCLNLLDTEHTQKLTETYQQIVAEVDMENLPRNTRRGAHFLDRFVIDTYCRVLEANALLAIQTVRGSFPEGEPIYSGSKILSRAHTQLAVRDAACLLDFFLVHFP